MQKPIVIEKGNTTSVDWTNYNLNLDEAARELKNGFNITVREYETFDDDLSFPEVIELDAEDYKHRPISQIRQILSSQYELFGKETAGNPKP